MSAEIPHLGWSADIVRIFIESKLSALLLIGSLLLGVVALVATPREEDPQIVVPVIDVAVAMPGASAREVELLAASPLESILAELPGVENTYSMSRPGACLVTVRFEVGQDRERSLTKVFTQLEANRHRVPPGVPGWQVLPVDIDDVPIVTLSLASRDVDDAALREIAHEVLADLHALPDVGRADVVGGRRREVRLVLDPARLAAFSLASLEVLRALPGSAAASEAGSLVGGDVEIPVHAGQFLRDAADVGRIVIAVRPDASGHVRAVRVRDVATIVDGPEEAVTLTRLGWGPAAADHGIVPAGWQASDEVPAVTIAVAKRRGSNAVHVARSIEARLDELHGTIVPSNVTTVLTRDYGETADHKVNELVKHLTIAVITVVVLLGLSLGWREAGIVALAVPMTLAFTLFADLVFGYSINRVTLFALILSLGLLVDDPIVDVENIHRHLRLRKHPPLLATLIAVDEIRPPTILATFTVIVSFLPMFFITGMMGPYMGPMAFNVPVAMLVSLLVAFTVTPWAAYHALRGRAEAPHPPGTAAASEPARRDKDAIHRAYSRLVRPLLASRRRALAFLSVVGLLFVGAVALGPLGLVPVKMLPFDNKNELLLVVDAPEGRSLESTDALLADLGAYLRAVPEVVSYQTYAGTAAPIDFNGLVRHYFLRKGPTIGDVRVNLLPKEERAWQSHAIALRLRPDLERIAAGHGVILKIVETPPGPPVLATLVAEVRGPLGASNEDLVAVAAGVKQALASIPHVSEVDWQTEEQRERLDVTIDDAKSALHGVVPADAVETVRLALDGGSGGALRTGTSREAIPITLRLPAADRADAGRLMSLRLRGSSGLVPLSEIATLKRRPEERTIFHKDLRPVAYVTAEPVGISPVEALVAAGKPVAGALPEGYSVEWNGEGEWKITTEVFRDLGLAFGAALVGIYILLVAQTGSLAVPGVIMLAIPLTMIGVFPGFFLLNVVFARDVGDSPNPIFFTAPGMIGLIALAGIVVRNSIILIDFIGVLRARGRGLHDAIVEAGATRLRPILLTAGAALFGAWVIVLDPIFSGLAWSFIFGIFASTAFTLLVVPTAYALLMAGEASKLEEA